MGNMHFRCNGQSLFCRNQIIFNICQIMHSQYIHLCINRNLYYALFLIIPIDRYCSLCIMLFYVLFHCMVAHHWTAILPIHPALSGPQILCRLWNEDWDVIQVGFGEWKWKVVSSCAHASFGLFRYLSSQWRQSLQNSSNFKKITLYVFLWINF